MDAIIANGTPTQVGLYNRMQSYVTALLANAQVQLRLFKTNTAIGPLTTLADLSEADFSGYAPQVISSWSGPFIDQNGTPYADSPLKVFQNNGGGTANTIYSIGLTVSTGAAATATATEAGGVVDAITVTGGGSGYQSPPKVTITDATVGTGATAHAVLTGGVVTSIVIDDGGSGYTGPIIALDHPAALVAGVNFVGGKRMAFITDAMACVFEITG